MKNGIINILSVVAITLSINMILVMADPESMVEMNVLATIFLLPLLSFPVSIAVYAFMRRVFHTNWWLVIPAVLLSVVSSFFAIITVIRIPGSSDFFASAANGYHVPTKNFYKIGDIPFYLTDTIEKVIPDGWSVMAVDADNTKGWYLFQAADKNEPKNYLIGFSNKTDPAQIQYVTVDQLWHQVQAQEKLSANTTFTQIFGIPTGDEDISIFDEFAQTKTIDFQTNNHFKFMVKISIKNNKVATSITDNKPKSTGG